MNVRSIARSISDPAERLAKLSREEGDCVVWIGCRDHDGYGKTRVHGGLPVRVHRLAWELANGRAVPSGLVVRHTCDNPPCIRPEHLTVGTVTDNNHDREQRGRSCVGSRHHAARLTPGAVRTIRKRTRAGESVVSVARDFGVRPWAVQKIRDGITWRHLEESLPLAHLDGMTKVRWP